MKNPVWEKAFAAAADPERTRRCFHLLLGTPAQKILENASPEQANLLAALFSGSEISGNQLAAHPDWLAALDIEQLRFPRREQGLRREIASWLQRGIAGKNFPETLANLRRFKQREMIRIAARDLARLGNAVEITRELSDLADVCLDAVWQICRAQAAERFGEPWHQDADGRWQPTAVCALALGKLGGQELNYSSDVDLVFVYADEGKVFRGAPDPKKSLRPALSNHSYFCRLAEAFVSEIQRVTAEGMLFRIDLRLRPEGDSGPLCRSLDSYENYYAQWGQTWERMMLIKARRVAGSAELAADFLETIQPFRYPRAVSENLLQEIAAMKERIENEVVRSGELDTNVKLGRGGIREIEFIAQSLQLLQAGRHPFLQGPQTLPALEKLAQYNWLTNGEVLALHHAYGFLRDVEHRLQMDGNLQTHTIPPDEKFRARLARLMGFKTDADFETARRTHTEKVRAIFEQRIQLKPPPARAAVFPRDFSDEAAWENLLAGRGFRHPAKARRELREFVEGPGYVHVSPRTIELAHQLLPRLLALCPQRSAESPDPARPAKILSDPDRVVTRLDNFITAYGARAPLFDLWNSNPAIFELLIQLFDRSEFLAELAIRAPDMMDELVTSGRLRRVKSAAETLRDLRHGLQDKDQFAWLRRYHQTERMRIGLRDILGLADPDQYLSELSTLADACVQYALEVLMRRNKLLRAPFAIIGLGKFGGAEIDYGSDLDIIFVAETKARDLQKMQKLAVGLIDLLSLRTELGNVFQTDARLRPDGEKGLLVNTLSALENYYRQRAQLWEIQALTRTRFIAGDPKTGQSFESMTAALANFKKPDRPLAAFPADWKMQIHKMRMRIEHERTPPGKDELAIKTGRGGLMDAEFIAQALCLENGWHIPNTLRALERGRDEKVLTDADKLIANYRQLRRVEGILRRWSYEGETVLPDDPAPYYRVAARCGFVASEKFRAALSGWRQAVREVYEKYFDAS